MTRWTKSTENFRPVVQLPGDLWRGVVCLSGAFQVNSSFILSFCYFGAVLKKENDERTGVIILCITLQYQTVTQPWLYYSHLTPWAPPSSLLLGSRTESTCSCLHHWRWHQWCWQWTLTLTDFLRRSGLKLPLATLRQKIQKSVSHILVESVRELELCLLFTLSAREEHDMSFGVFPVESILVESAYRAA